jgi:hypothetical protein
LELEIPKSNVVATRMRAFLSKESMSRTQ